MMHLDTLSQTERNILRRVHGGGGTLALTELDGCESEIELLKTLGLVRLLHHTTKGDLVGLTNAARAVLDPSLSEAPSAAVSTSAPAPANGVNPAPAAADRSLMVLRQIANGNGIDPARVDGRSVRKLERLGWVERRRKLLYVTDEGRAQLNPVDAAAPVKSAPVRSSNGTRPTEAPAAPVEIEVAVEAESPAEASDILTRVAEAVEHGIEGVPPLAHAEFSLDELTEATDEATEALRSYTAEMLLNGCPCANVEPNCFNRQFLLRIMAANPQIRTAYDALRYAEDLISELKPGQD